MWMHQWIADRYVFGNAYNRKLGGGSSKALVPLPPTRVTPRGGNLISPGSYDFRSGNETVNIAADQIVHSRRYNPVDARIGVSPLEPLRVILRSDAAALAHMENVWLNGARTGGWLKLPEELSEEAINRLRESLRKAYSGSRNSGKVGILEGGADFKSDTWDPKESQFIEGRKLTLETVARAMNVPLSVLSLSENATYASAKEFHQQLYVDTLGPIFSTIEEEIEAFIVPWIGGGKNIQVRFNVEEKLRGSFEEQVVAYRNALGVPFLSVNEVRALQNLSRIDDDDFDLPVKPSNVVYGDAQVPGEAPMPAIRGDGEPPLRALPGGNQ
jgi:HK97 family phage portal protein